MTSWKPEVQVVNEPDWHGNALRFATREEAKAYVKDLEMRWTQVVDTRVVKSDDKPNYTWSNDRGAEGIKK